VGFPLAQEHQTVAEAGFPRLEAMAGGGAQGGVGLAHGAVLVVVMGVRSTGGFRRHGLGGQDSGHRPGHGFQHIPTFHRTGLSMMNGNASVSGRRAGHPLVLPEHVPAPGGLVQGPAQDEEQVREAI